MRSWSLQSTYRVVVGAHVRFVIWWIIRRVSLPCRNPACSSEISVLVFTRILSSMIRRRILLAWETRAIVLWFALCLRLPFSGSGMKITIARILASHNRFSFWCILCWCLRYTVYWYSVTKTPALTECFHINNIRIILDVAYIVS